VLNLKSRLKNKAVLLTTGFLFLQHSLIFAAPLELSLDDSIALALQNNAAIKIAGEDREKSEWGISEAKAGKLPSMSLGSNYSVKDFSAGGDVSNSLRLNWQVYSGGRVEGQVKQAELGLTSADLNVEKTKQQIKLDATTGYYNVLQTSNMVSVNQATVNGLQEHLKMVQAQYDAGVVAKADVLRSEVELANAEQNLTKAQNNYDLAVSALLNTMNIDANTELSLKNELTYAPYDKTLEESIALAKANRPDAAQAEVNINNAATGVKIAQSGNLPSVSMSASTGLSDSFALQDDSWSINLAANWNIFDGGVTKAKIKQAETSLDKAKLQAEQTMDSIEQEVRQSYLSMQEAEKRLKTTEVAVGKAEEDLDIAREKYNAGVGTNLDVIDAQLALTQAKTNHIQALYDFNVNKAKLDKAIGYKVD